MDHLGLGSAPKTARRKGQLVLGAIRAQNGGPSSYGPLCIPANKTMATDLYSQAAQGDSGIRVGINTLEAAHT